MEHPAGDWSLVIKISRVNEGLNLTILYMNSDKFREREILIDVPPFYVGAGVWELDYGSTLMTLEHPSLCEHPAKIMWEKWKCNR